MRRALALSSILVAALAGCRDSRCNADNCNALRDKCHVEFAAGGTIGNCLAKGLTPPADFDYANYCGAACDSENAGGFADCLGKTANQCGSDSTPQQQACESQIDPSHSEGCVQICGETEYTCARDCPTDSWASCSTCQAKCGDDFVTCLGTCPAAQK